MQAIIHEKSSGAPLSELDLFGVPPTQFMIERDIVTEHRPISTLNSDSFIQFEIPTAADEYFKFEDLFLYMRVKVSKPATLKTDADWAKIAPVNYLLHSMIKQLDIFIGDKQVTTSPSTYSYKAYFEALLGYHHAAKKSHLSSALWFNDEDMKYENPILDWGKQLNKGKEIELMGKLHTDLAYQGRSLLGGAKITIKILLNDAKFFFMAKDFAPEMEFLEAALFVHRSKVYPQIVEAHNTALKIAPAKYPITHAVVKPCTIQKGTFDVHIDNIHSGQLPRRIFVAFVKNQAYCGDYSLNPYNFKDFGITSLSVSLDGIQYPAKAFTPDFENGKFQREQNSLFSALNMLGTDSTVNINRDNYSKGNTIFGFNFAPDLSNGCGATGHLNQIKFGTLRMQVRFAKALDEPVTALVFCEFDKILEVDINRRAAIDFM